jgi:hypothetical protein
MRVANFPMGLMAELMSAVVSRASAIAIPGCASSSAGLGRIPEAKLATARVLALSPTFTTAETCAGIGVPTALAAPFTKASHAAGLP